MFACNGDWRGYRDYIPASPSESSQVRAVAHEQLEQLRGDGLLKSRHAFLEHMQNLTNELIGIYPKPAVSISASQSADEKARELEMKPLPEELRQPSEEALHSIREMRGRTLTCFSNVLLPTTGRKAQHKPNTDHRQYLKPAQHDGQRKVDEAADISVSSIRSGDKLGFDMPRSPMPATRTSPRQHPPPYRDPSQHESPTERGALERNIHGGSDDNGGDFELAAPLENVKDCFQHCFNDESYVIDGAEVVSIGALNNALLRKAQQDDPLGAPTYHRVREYLQRYAEQSGRRFLPSAMVDKLTTEAVMGGSDDVKRFRKQHHPHQFEMMHDPVLLEPQSEQSTPPKLELPSPSQFTFPEGHGDALERAQDPRDESDGFEPTSPTSEQKTNDSTAEDELWEEEDRLSPNMVPAQGFDRRVRLLSVRQQASHATVEAEDEEFTHWSTAAPPANAGSNRHIVQPSDDVELDLRGNYRPTNAELLRESLDLSHCSSQVCSQLRV